MRSIRKIVTITAAHPKNTFEASGSVGLADAQNNFTVGHPFF